MLYLIVLTLGLTACGRETPPASPPDDEQTVDTIAPTPTETASADAADTPDVDRPDPPLEGSAAFEAWMALLEDLERDAAFSLGVAKHRQASPYFERHPQFRRMQEIGARLQYHRRDAAPLLTAYDIVMGDETGDRLATALRTLRAGGETGRIYLRKAMREGDVNVVQRVAPTLTALRDGPAARDAADIVLNQPTTPKRALLIDIMAAAPGALRDDQVDAMLSLLAAEVEPIAQSADRLSATAQVVRDAKLAADHAEVAVKWAQRAVRDYERALEASDIDQQRRASLQGKLMVARDNAAYAQRQADDANAVLARAQQAAGDAAEGTGLSEASLANRDLLPVFQALLATPGDTDTQLRRHEARRVIERYTQAVEHIDAQSSSDE